MYAELTNVTKRYGGEVVLDKLNRRLEDKQMNCTVSDEAKQYIIDAAYDPQYGARPLRRYVQHTVETLIARRIIAGDILPGAQLHVTVKDGALAVDA